MLAKRLRFWMNLWPPFLGAGIKVDYIAEDYREARISLHTRWYNRNYVGTHFGGSLFAMTDPFLMLMYLHNLGREYLVWDQAASIRFVSPGRGTVSVCCEIDEEHLQQARLATADGDKFLVEHRLQILDQEQKLVAEVDKTIYIRRKKSAR